MRDLFSNCYKLTSISLLNLDTSLVTDMSSMFEKCYSLLSLNLSSFNTSMVVDMGKMFYGCHLLTSLDISNFNIKNIYNLDSMFYECEKLIYINFYNYFEQNPLIIDNIFYETSENLVVCINKQSNVKSLINQLSSKRCIIHNCQIDFEDIPKKKKIYETRVCIDNCNSDEDYKYEYANFCYDQCPKESHSSKDNIYFCEINPLEILVNDDHINV